MRRQSPDGPGGDRARALGMRDNVAVNDVPRNTVTRTAKLAGLPIGLAARTALGFGKRIGGRPAEIVAEEIQRRTADQIFRVLGELKGGAMKLGQALSIFEAALPPEIAGPVPGHADQAAGIRAAAARPHRAPGPGGRELGEDWRSQVRGVRRHARRGGLDRAGPPRGLARRPRGRGEDPVSRRRARADQRLQPALAGRAAVRPADAGARGQAAARRAARPGGRGTRLRAGGRRRSTRSPRPTAATRTSTCRTWSWAPAHVLVSEWMDGTPLSRIISDGSKEQRDRAGILLVRFLFSGPARAGLLHADPHPGNFRLLDDGRLGVLDFGAVDRLPDGLPPFFGRLLRIMHDPDELDIGAVERELRAQRVPAAGHRRRPGGAAGVPGADGRAVQGGLVQVHPRMAARARRPGSPTCGPTTSPASSTCRRPTCSSTGCPRPASACCASWSARASSGPRCCSGCRAT